MDVCLKAPEKHLQTRKKWKSGQTLDRHSQTQTSLRRKLIEHSLQVHQLHGALHKVIKNAEDLSLVV